MQGWRCGESQARCARGAFVQAVCWRGGVSSGEHYCRDEQRRGIDKLHAGPAIHRSVRMAAAVGGSWRRDSTERASSLRLRGGDSGPTLRCGRASSGASLEGSAALSETHVERPRGHLQASNGRINFEERPWSRVSSGGVGPATRHEAAEGRNGCQRDLQSARQAALDETPPLHHHCAYTAPIDGRARLWTRATSHLQLLNMQSARSSLPSTPYPP
jgi:hypothetical protein